MLPLPKAAQRLALQLLLVLANNRAHLLAQNELIQELRFIGTSMRDFSKNIEPFVTAELRAAALDPNSGFSHLERAHILGQESTWQHVRVHWHMMIWGIHNADAREIVGQIMRIVGAATKTVFGLVPAGNSGGSNVSPFARMTVPGDLQRLIDLAKR